jgi:hypothetical protein
MPFCVEVWCKTLQIDRFIVVTDSGGDDILGICMNDFSKHGDANSEDYRCEVWVPIIKK